MCALASQYKKVLVALYFECVYGEGAAPGPHCSEYGNESDSEEESQGQTTHSRISAVHEEAYLG